MPRLMKPSSLPRGMRPKHEMTLADIENRDHRESERPRFVVIPALVARERLKRALLEDGVLTGA
jgi:hypothetical protein